MHTILVLGSGGREHALCWKIAQSSIHRKLYIAPGNPGTEELGENVNISVNDFKKIKEFIVEKNVDIVVVGPEDPLVNGIHDYLKNDKRLTELTVIGPRKGAAQLEGSKDFSKEFMKEVIYDYHRSRGNIEEWFTVEGNRVVETTYGE